MRKTDFLGCIDCKRIVLLLCFICLSVYSCRAQSPTPLVHRNSLGLFYGFGTHSLEFVELNTRYQYEIRQLEIQYSYTLFPGQLFDLDVVASPQVNLSRYNSEFSTVEESKGAEWGFTAGFSPRIHSEDRNMAFYLQVSSGPLYITGSPDRQSYGLNFASNFLTGVYFRILNKLNLDFRAGFRHLSNAQIRYPNDGINNLIWSVGVSYGL